MWLETEPILEWGSNTRCLTHLQDNKGSVTQSSASLRRLPSAQLSLGSCPNPGLKGPAPQQTTFCQLLLKSPPRRNPCFCSKDIPRQEMGSRHHECLITLIGQVQVPPHSLSTLWETVIKRETACFYYSSLRVLGLLGVHASPRQASLDNAFSFFFFF